jgi:transketolase
MDTVQQANSGHPGAPMGMADILEALWQGFLRHNPGNPAWPNRDRFVLSNGHGSAVLYALLHLSGYDLGIDDLKQFRQLHSRTPGHPEYRETPGVETTTGPLGQGLANAVGMALAEHLLAAHFNRPGLPIVDHYTYVAVGDGCLMEGISHEVCSLAGTLGLGKLIVLYDDNGISIDGDVSGWFADDTPTRFAAYGFHVVAGIDGHEAEAVTQALRDARAMRDRPSILCLKTVIGYGAPTKQGTAGSHGAPLGAEEIARTRAALDWPHAPFEVPEGIRAAWDARPRGAAAEREWQALFADYGQHFPALAAEFTRRVAGTLPAEFGERAAALVQRLQQEQPTVATRRASQLALDALAPALPELLGGSADLTESNLTHWQGARTISPAHLQGEYLSYGVREFGMTAIQSGIALHGGFIPFGGTFLVFSDYARNAIRMAALMRLRSILVLTHDSIGLGEDGPTHQPVEHAASLRLIPHLHVWRPCDAVETAVAWRAALERADGPSALLLSRQNLPAQPRDAEAVAGIARGGYVLADCDGVPEAIVIATGSEIPLAVAAASAMQGKGYGVRVVSMPCAEVFAAQDVDYRDAVLPPQVYRRFAVEAGVTAGWWQWVGNMGTVMGVDGFGCSAPAPQIFRHFGLTEAGVTERLLALLTFGREEE